MRKVIQEVFGNDRSLIVRPGIILGPREDIGRGQWWLERMKRGGDILAPGSPDDGFQFVDVRALADFMLHQLTLDDAAFAGRTEVNAVSPRLKFEDFLNACLAATQSKVERRLTWIPNCRLLSEEGVMPMTSPPLWVPNQTTWNVDPTRARDYGLAPPDLLATMKAVQEWLDAGGRPIRNERFEANGLKAQTEERILRQWLTAQVSGI